MGYVHHDLRGVEAADEGVVVGGHDMVKFLISVDEWFGGAPELSVTVSEVSLLGNARTLMGSPSSSSVSRSEAPMSTTPLMRSVARESRGVRARTQ